MKDFLLIGEISALFGLNIQTLYYYDSIDLFRPRVRDEKNGRRKYEFDQIYELATICYMRKIGYSLDEIQERRRTQRAESTLKNLKQRSIELHSQWQELLMIDEAIQRKIRFIEREMERIQKHEICIRSFPARKYIPIGGEDMLYRHNSFYFYPTIAFYRREEKYFGAYLLSDEVEETFMAPFEEVLEIPAGEYLCGYHLGAYERVPETIHRLRTSRPDLWFDETTINFNILDQFVENDSANYITHMQIRILDR